MQKLWLKNYPPNVPHKLAPLNKTLIEEFEQACKEFDKKPAFISFNKKLSYGELYEKSQSLARYLQAEGFKKGDVFVIQLPNLLQYPVALWGALLAGLKLVNMNPLYRAKEMLLPLKETQAKGIVLLSNKLKDLSEILDQVFLQKVIFTHPGDLLDFPKKTFFNLLWKYKHGKQTQPLKNISCSSLSLALKRDSSPTTYSPPSSPPFADSKDTEILIQYTGGTTGIIKGVSLTESNILSNLKQCELWMRSDLQKGKEVALAALPLGHIFSFLVNGLVFFCSGYTNVLIANPKKINAMVSVLKKQKISIGTGLNTLFKALLKNKNFKKLDFSSWKIFISGGMTLESSIQKEWEACTNSRLIEGYGLTESSPVVCVDRLDKPNKTFVGYPLPSTEVRITNSEGKELGLNQKGELEVRGPQVMKGYYKNPKETLMVLNSEGWLKTGDIASINEQGLIQIVDRKKDMINIAGFKVYPNEVEQVLLSYPPVKDCVVIGEKDQDNKEYLKAFIIKKQELLNKEHVLSHCQKNLAPYKIPKQIAFCQHIPKNFIGKNLRQSLKN